MLISKLSFVLFTVLCITACSKDKAPGNINEVLPAGTTLVSGSFTGSDHPTSGTVKIIQETGGNKNLVFENFQGFNGPDLRVWLSPNQTSSPYQEAGLLKATSGNFYYPVTASLDYSANKYVLIWCKKFSVLFGYAVLQ